MRIVFMGSPDFAVPSLQALMESDHEILAVYSQPPRPAGRGQKERKTPVHTLAEANNLPAFTPVKLIPEEIEKLKAMQPDIIAVAAYGLILPQGVLDIAPCINVHPSALPRWRGAAPVQYTVLKGDATTDMCIMEMEKGLDTGAVYKRVPYNVGENETAGELHDRMAMEGGKHLVDVIDRWEELKDKAVPQGGETIYAHKITKDMKAINWAQSAQEVHNHIRGMSPFPGATFEHNSSVLKVLKSEKMNTSGKAGEILAVEKDGITIACAEGAVKLDMIQKPGKKVMATADLLNGYEISVGELVS